MTDFTQITGMSGLEVLQGTLKGDIPQATGLHEALNIRFVAVEKGQVVFEGSPSGHCRNPHGTIHGGWYLTILDGAMGLAVFSTQEAGKMSATATMESKIIRPLKIGGQYRATGQVMNAGRSMVHVEARLEDVESGKLMATATSTYAVLDRPTS